MHYYFKIVLLSLSLVKFLKFVMTPNILIHPEEDNEIFARQTYISLRFQSMTHSFGISVQRN